MTTEQERQKMFCRNCGVQISDQVVFCENCGAAIQSDANTAQTAVQPYSNQNTYGVQSYPNQNTYAAQPFPNVYPEEPPIRTKYSWVPITLAVIAFLIDFKGSGGDSDLNVFDWISAIISIVSFFSTFYLIPQRRKVLRTVAIIITGFMAFAWAVILLGA